MSKAVTVTRAKRSGSGAKRATTRGSSGKRSKANGAASTARAQKLDDVSAELEELLPEGKLYYRIGEVSQITGVKAYVLRYWESEFRWMAPQKSRSKQRLYRRKDIEMILLIRKLLYAERYTIAGARQRLRELGAKAKAAGTSHESVASHVETAQTDYRGRFRDIKRELVAIRASL